MKIQSITGSREQIDACEANLRKDGFVLLRSMTTKDLQPGEYFKNSFSGTENSAVGPESYSITWSPRGAA